MITKRYSVVVLLLVSLSGSLYASDAEHPLLPYADTEELIFILSERAAKPTGIEPPNDTQLAIHHLVVDEYFSLIEDFNAHFNQYEQIAPKELPTAWKTINAEFKCLANSYTDELSQAYHALIVSGEIASRFGVNKLPAVIQLQGRNRFKISYDAADFDTALNLLKGQDYEVLTP